MLYPHTAQSPNNQLRPSNAVVDTKTPEQAARETALGKASLKIVGSIILGVTAILGPRLAVDNLAPPVNTLMPPPQLDMDYRKFRAELGMMELGAELVLTATGACVAFNLGKSAIEELDSAGI